jgi:DNA-binding MarR family transcriptional regulator
MEPDDRRHALNRILELTVLLNDDMTRDLARRGLTGSRAHLLWELRDGIPKTQQALAKALGVSPRTITGLVDGLATSGFVTREPHPTDRRAALVTYTKKGERAANALERDHTALTDKLFGDMAASTFSGFTRGLDAVLARLHELLAGKSEHRAR